MNIVLLDPRQTESELWSITSKRQLEHLQQHVNVQVGDTLKVGIREGKRYLTEIVEVTEQSIKIKPIPIGALYAVNPAIKDHSKILVISEVLRYL